MAFQYDPVDLDVLISRHKCDARSYEAFCTACFDGGTVPEQQMAHWNQSEAASFQAVLRHPAKTIDELRAQLRYILEFDDEDRILESLDTLAWQPIAAELEQAVHGL